MHSHAGAWERVYICYSNCSGFLLLVGIICLNKMNVKGNHMKWKGAGKSTNVEDRRATSSARRGGIPSGQMIMILWPIIKPLLRTKVGLTILAIGLGTHHIIKFALNKTFAVRRFCIAGALANAPYRSI